MPRWSFHTLPRQAAGAFVYDGQEYFDVWFGISPAAWGLCAFSILFGLATVKNAAQKYNTPVSKKPVKIGGFVGKEVENNVAPYKV